MLEVDVVGARLAPTGMPPAEVRRLCEATAQRLAVGAGHVAVEFVDRGRIAELNAFHRGSAAPTDVLSFPIDGQEAVRAGDGKRGPGAGAGGLASAELGDVIICPACTADVGEAIVHGMLHLLGMDHETDEGEMLALQAELLAELRR